MTKSDAANAKELIDQKITWGTYTDEVIAAVQEGDDELAQEVMLEEVIPRGNQLIQGFNQLSQETDEEIQRDSAVIEKAGEEMMTNLTVLSIVTPILAVIVALSIARKISNPIQKIKNRMEIIAAGDLSSEPLEVKGEDEIAHLMTAANEMSFKTAAVLKEASTIAQTNGLPEMLPYKIQELL